MAQQLWRMLLRGQLPELLPPLQHKAVRVFTVNAGTDMVVESRFLEEFVYPEIREHCRSKHGIEFQIVHLDHNNTLDALLLEKFQRDLIADCSVKSRGPSFLLFLGQKYGDVSIPYEINGSLYELFVQTMNRLRGQIARDIALLDTCYLRDDNAESFSYALVSPQALDDELRQMIRRLFDFGMKHLLDLGLSDENEIYRYMSSDFERSIDEALASCRNPQLQCICFSRVFEDIANFVASNALTADYTDIELSDGGMPLRSESCALKLNDVEEKLSLFGISGSKEQKFKILWRNNGGVDADWNQHASYLNRFCKTVRNTLAQRIDEAVEKNMIAPNVTRLQERVWEHWQFCLDEEDIYQVNDHLVQDLRAYLSNRSDRRPLLLLGEEGSGKDTLVAHAALNVTKWMPESYVVVRFLGPSFGLTNLFSLFLDISKQLFSIVEDLEISNEIMQTADCHERAAVVFSQNLETFSKLGLKLFLFLNGVDNLNNLDFCHFPSILPDNVKMVLSADSGNVKLSIQQIYRSVSAPAFSIDDCLDALERALKTENRMLRQAQVEFLSQIFEECSLPWFVYLVSKMALEWRSSTNMGLGDLDTFPSNITEVVSCYFDKAVSALGEIFVGRICSYLICSESGLSYNELQYLMIADDSIFEMANNLKIETDLKETLTIFLMMMKLFLRSHNEPDATVIYWCNSLVENIAISRFLKDEQLKIALHSRLADYYLGHSISRTRSVKPYDQPLVFPTEAELIRYNYRKFKQLPLQLFRSNRIRELKELVVFNYGWLFTKTNATCLDIVLEDFQFCSETEALLVKDALHSSAPAINRNSEHMAAELAGRLLPHCDKFPNINRLVHKCDSIRAHSNPILPISPFHKIPSGSWKKSIPINSTLNCFQFEPKSRLLLMKDKSSNEVVFLNPFTGSITKEFTTSIGSLHLPDGNSNILIIFDELLNTFKFHSTDTGKFIHQVIPVNHMSEKPKEKVLIRFLSVSETKVYFVLSSSDDYIMVIDMDSSWETQSCFTSSRVTALQPHSSDSLIFAVLTDRLVVYHWENSFQIILDITLDSEPKNLLLTDDLSTVVFQDSDRAQIIAAYKLKADLAVNEIDVIDDVISKDIGDSVVGLIFSGDQSTVLVHACEHLVLLGKYLSSELIRFEIPTDSNANREGQVFDRAGFLNDRLFFGTIGRTVHIFSAEQKCLVASLTGPLSSGFDMITACHRNILITKPADCDAINVWHFDEHTVIARQQIDKLPGPVTKIEVSSDGCTAFVFSENSMQIYIFDVHTGKVIDILTHDNPVLTFTITHDGQFCWSVVKGKRSNPNNNIIWQVASKTIVHHSPFFEGFVVPLHTASSFIYIDRSVMIFRSPFYIKQFSFSSDQIEELNCELPINKVLSEPFVTSNDKYLVVLTAQQFDEKLKDYTDPAVSVFSITNDYLLAVFGNEELSDFLNAQQISAALPCPENPYMITVFYRNTTTTPSDGRKTPETWQGYLFLDIITRAVSQVNDAMFPGTLSTNSLVMGSKSCLYANSGAVYDLKDGIVTPYHHNSLKRSAPLSFCIDDLALLHESKSEIFVVSLDGEQLGSFDVGHPVSCIRVCRDTRTILIGKEDGSFSSCLIALPSGDPESPMNIPGRVNMSENY